MPNIPIGIVLPYSILLLPCIIVSIKLCLMIDLNGVIFIKDPPPKHALALELPSCSYPSCCGQYDNLSFSYLAKLNLFKWRWWLCRTVWVREECECYCVTHCNVYWSLWKLVLGKGDCNSCFVLEPCCFTHCSWERMRTQTYKRGSIFFVSNIEVYIQWII